MILHGDALEMLKTLETESVQCCVTSPPYWGLRDYGVNGQIGLEKTPEEYVDKLVEVFREVKRVLRDDGVLWLNLGDSYWNSNGFARADAKWQRDGRNNAPANDRVLPPHDILKVKDLVGIPWRVAFALQTDGWYLRSDIIWAKPNPMPESVTDRPTKSHEYIFLLSKSARYYYDAEAVKEESVAPGSVHVSKKNGQKMNQMDGIVPQHDIASSLVRNVRSVWNLTTKPFKGAHFATFPPEIPERCIKAGSREGDTILDPFAGSGTTLEVAERLGRKAIGIELNEKYVKDLIEPRVANVNPLFRVSENA